YPLFVASSMPVRDLQSFGVRRPHPPRVAANRGASGIDGTVACAAGYGAGLDQRVTVLLGDQALLHDLSSLPALTQLPRPPVLVVVNNGGGGIFSLLPIASSGALEPSQFETLFAAGHSWSFGPLAEAFGLAHHTPSSPGSLREALHQAHTEDQPALIEVRTSRGENATWHRSLAEGARAAAEASIEETP
ncbi:MAG: thiamine pyrophosphate-binding protein, partial [Myxococcota bacterium]|nr:thiamine pyrophosphate-binding protein [Myxococcota bacterium]